MFYLIYEYCNVVVHITYWLGTKLCMTVWASLLSVTDRHEIPSPSPATLTPIRRSSCVFTILDEHRCCRCEYDSNGSVLHGTSVLPVEGLCENGTFLWWDMLVDLARNIIHSLSVSIIQQASKWNSGHLGSPFPTSSSNTCPSPPTSRVLDWGH